MGKCRRRFRTQRELEVLLEEYFEKYLPEVCEIGDVESLCVFLGISRKSFDALCCDSRYSEMLDSAKTHIANIKKQLAMTGKIPASVFSFDFKNNHGYCDKSEDKAQSAKIVIEGKAKSWSE
ncbi:MAG TPA: terminase small subunit [Bacillota bacterium]|nr:terminase small subunit [Bacillota bacterium]